jgi:hypothetical protein
MMWVRTCLFILLLASGVSAETSSIREDVKVHREATDEKTMEDPKVTMEDPKVHRENSPACSSRDQVDELMQTFHNNEACDRGSFNKHKKAVRRDLRHSYLQETGTYAKVPDQLTLVCPKHVQDNSASPEETGYDTGK